MTVRQLAALAAAVILVGCDMPPESQRLVGQTASDRIELSAEAAEQITEILVAEGSPVRAGQPLVRQDTARAAARIRVAEAAVSEAAARLAELVRGPRSEAIQAARANVDGAEQQVRLRRAEWRRTREVFERKLVSAEARDTARAALDSAEATLAAYRAQLEELLAGTTVEELDQADARLAGARAELDAARVELDKRTLAAPVDGIADSRLFEIGERPAPGQPVMVLLGGAQAHVRVYVPESERALVRPGMPAQVFVDGLEAPVDGTVRWVAAEPAFTPYFALTERDRGRLTYLAKIDLPLGDERLPDGVPVEVEFVTGE
jgi:HlyD family secretion protein